MHGSIFPYLWLLNAMDNTRINGFVYLRARNAGFYAAMAQSKRTHDICDSINHRFACPIAMYRSPHCWPIDHLQNLSVVTKRTQTLAYLNETIGTSN